MNAWGFAAGIAAGVLAGGGRTLWLTAAACGTAVVFRHRLRLGVLLLLAGVVVGAIRVEQTAAPVTEISPLARQVRTCRLAGTVDHRSGSMGTFFAIEAVGCAGGYLDLSTVVVADASRLEPGSQVAFSGRLSPLLSGSFDSALRRMGAEARVDVLGAVEIAEPEGISGLAAAVRSRVDRSSARLPEPERALMNGLVIGDTHRFSPQLEERYRRAGLSHLVAVSGSNIAIVAGTLLLLGARLAHLVRYLLAGAGIAFYVVVVGPDPSVLRAAAMGGIAIAAAIGGYRTESWAALGTAVGAVVAFRPDLLFSPGLHLSAAATAGIVLWARPIAERLPGPRTVAMVTGVTLAAQVAVTPVLAFTFAEVSLASLPANLLAAPAVAPATVLGLGSGSIPWLSSVLVQLATPAVAWIDLVAGVFGDATWAQVSVDHRVGWFAALMVACLLFKSLRIYLRRAG